MRDTADAVASFVPALVGRSPDAVTRFDAAVVFVDAVEFTSRAGALVESGPGGIERLSALLDAHYAPLLATIAARGGEAIRFVGDALIAVFPAEGQSQQEAVLAAAACGLAVQQAGRPPMPDGKPLAVRVVVTAGTVRLLRATGGRRSHFVLAGEPLAELTAWTSSAGPGHVVLAPSAAALTGGRVSGAPIGDRAAKEPAGLRLERVDDDASSASPGDAAPPSLPLGAFTRFVPGPVLARIESGHLDWLAELRRVTAVFVAIRGLDVARVADVLVESDAIAERHETDLKELVLDDKGWTLVALTGVPPYARADDAVRAVRFARALLAALAARGLEAQVGVASGRAFCGAVGSVERREYAVTGTAMNLASRLSQAAAPGSILCDEETSRSARASIPFEPLPPVRLKGFREPVAVAAPGADDVADRPQAGLVGREAERALLASLLDGARASEPPPALLLEAEPGMGKSRLASELLGLAASRRLAHRVGTAEATSRTAAYRPWRAIVEGLLEARDAAAVADALGADDAPFAPLLEAIVPLGLGDNEATMALAGQVRARRTRELCVRLLARAAARSPLLVVLEDAHWADEASWDLLRDVVGARLPGLLVVVTSRPEGADRLDALEAAGATRRRLTGLSEDATRALLAASLDAHAIDEGLARRVHERAAGNPLFVQQLALSLAESRAVRIEGGRCSVAAGVDVASIALPATVEGAITARVDALTPSSQLVLKVASVLGPAFPRKLLADVHPRAEERAHLDERLDDLRARQLVDRGPADDVIRFRHEVVRDVVYETMLFEQRRPLHRDVAAWYEREHAGELAPFLALLAHHHRHAGSTGRAVDYLEQDAIRTFSMGLPRQSVALGLDGAGLLGAALPADPSAVGARIGERVGQTMGALAGRAPSDLLAMPPMTDPATLRTVHLLLELAPFTFQAGRPDLYALIGLTLLGLVLERGNAAPDVYSTYSVVHRAIHRDARGAHAWSELALALDAQQGGAARARVAFVHGWFHAHWLRPLRESLPASLEAAEIALAGGDLLFGCFNLSAHVVYAAAAGRPLPAVCDLARAHLARNGRRVVNAAFHCIHEMQVAKVLAGRTRGRLSLTDDEFDEERDVASICASDFYNQVGYYLVSRVKLHALFGEPRAALEWAGKLGPLQAAIAGQIAEIDLTLYRTLAAVDTGALDVAREGVAEIARWAEACPANFEHLSLLVRAALAGAEGRSDEAAGGYEQAAAAAEGQGFVQHAALAHERAWRLLGGRERRDRAVDAYGRWGAAAKVADLTSS